MDSVTGLANHIERTLDGPMWHGPALLEILNGVSPDAAAARPVPGGHTIWELVLHTAVWAEIARARLRGDAVESPPPAEDFPAPAEPTAEQWAAAIGRLDQSYRDLARAVSRLSDGDLALPIPTAGAPHTAEHMIRGVIEHGTYHGGQIALLKRARP
ncbi:MAG: hypothetical protein JWM41_4906 [Gemmatimonadetes bacterium]|nr:hypothetical protein [Gemmatimonadota bacterium]